MLEQQYRRRLRSYAALAYTVRSAAGKPESSEQTAQSEAAVFVSREQFSQRFAADLEGATREVLLCVPSLSARSVQRMIPLLQRLQHKGGEVRIYLPDPAQFRADIQPKITANAAALQRAGIPVMFCPNRLPNFCILDQRLVWYGSLNPLGRMPGRRELLADGRAGCGGGADRIFAREEGGRLKGAASITIRQCHRPLLDLSF